MEQKIPWDSAALEWNAEQLTKLIKSRDELKDYQFEMTDDGKIKFVHDGMSPLAALRRADAIKEEEEMKQLKEHFQNVMI